MSSIDESPAPKTPNPYAPDASIAVNASNSPGLILKIWQVAAPAWMASRSPGLDG